MEGKRIFAEAIRRMSQMLSLACAEAGTQVQELDLIVPHQANGRIIEAIRARLKLPQSKVWNDIRFTGNTSSSSIPLALDRILRDDTGAIRLGLCAFGAGYTFGGAILDATSAPASRG
jgi:2-oxoisovalerate dehydrogenase E1 component